MPPRNLSGKQLRFLFATHPKWRHPTAAVTPKVKISPMVRREAELRSHKFSSNIGGHSANYRGGGFRIR